MIVFLLASAGALSACETTSEIDTAAQIALAEKKVAMVEPYVEEGETNIYDRQVPYFGGSAAAVGVLALINTAFLFADMADSSDIGRHVSIYKVDGRAESHVKQDALLPPGRYRLGVKHCHEGSLKPPCSQLVNLEFEAVGGEIYQLVLLNGTGVMLREKWSKLPVAWGDAGAVTAEAYQTCLLDEQARRRRAENKRLEDSYVEGDVMEDVRQHCRETHPLSYQRSLSP